MRYLCCLSVFLFLGVAPATAQDPAKVDAKHYKVELENDHVRVLRITYAAGEKSVMHDHPSGVAVFLNDQQVKFTLPDGKTEDVQDKAGAVRWGAGGKHLPENTGGKPFELVVVELKTGPGTAAVAAEEDPAKVAAKNCKVEVDNEHVRVLRWNLGPGEKVPMHAHPALVTVSLTGGHNRFTMADGTTREARGKRGQVTWSAAEKHAGENLSNNPAEVIQIEIKGAPAKAAPAAGN